MKTKDFFAIFLFLTLTFVIYILFIFTIPIAQEPHGWLALNGFDNPLWSSWINELIFGSSLICALLGTLMMTWIPILSPSAVRNFWSLTYAFIWFDTILTLSMEYQTLGFLWIWICGLLFLFLFFHLLHFLGFEPQGETIVWDWKVQIIYYWIWGWMSFYFSLSFLLVYESFKYSDLRLPLSFGALGICFLNYVFSLYLKKAEGHNVDQYSKIGRTLFVVWFVLLMAFWLGQKWNF